MRSEINRRARQEVSSHRYREYYSYLKKNGLRVELFHKSLGDDYRWGRAIGDNFFISWYKLKGLKNKLLVMLCALIRICARIKAHKTLRETRKDAKSDYWVVSR